MTGQSTFRRLWQPPGRYEDRATDRRVTFLEVAAGTAVRLMHLKPDTLDLG